MAEENPAGPVIEVADDADVDIGPMEIESLCMNCEENGVTRILMTNIPCYKDVVLMAFQCPHCGYRNQELQKFQTCEEKGATFEVQVQENRDLNRTVVKGEYATVKVPDIDLELPSLTQQGTVSTIEGVLTRTVEDLSQTLEQLQESDPESAKSIAAFIERVQTLLTLEKPFTFILDDPSGNSFVENPYAPAHDSHGTITHYTRSHEQNVLIDAVPQADHGLVEQPDAEPVDEVGTDEVLHIAIECTMCNAMGENRIKMTDIPYFGKVIIMAFTCDACGYKTNEVKPGGDIPPHGKKITLRVTDPDDLNRDVLKSDTARIDVPEVGLELLPGTLGGRFTTIEGLLTEAKEQLVSGNPMSRGDSATEERRKRWQNFMNKMSDAIEGKMVFTFIIDDPLSKSYVQNIYAPDADPNMTIEEYERTYEQNEDYGLNDLIEMDRKTHEDEAHVEMQ
eukprot:TRINITY_DN12953_c0_g1::TRINITY_DN12953_c0_g1_i1::g.11075::m.11075 TRINITY_DN12953_c0_g1::TRINITY_DN12953_c0_g1_i1::g.11075  ORF type:complete len:471 (-),score=146.63,sp/O13724/ZPR1_SCHPO/45.11/3e-127,zf-ZPR1/PF03367.8/5.6e-53,zf-ZPR1/PF03367.8/2.9e-54,HypA/PF01155.14/0.054,HypA/PF01155.14/41,Zn-ribbon_8/PF09723.5/8.8e+02,Zn-ribbon_8/PF09723.5/3.3,Zn-ribbon_8/PF09723.5/1.6e+03,Zn-ribbon_8/PF09723.5/41,Pox_A22/PF04848.8/23,Pox_A22/PF04848.8/11,UPF0547/PF10571.4/0.37,UPF0547/PF10571.4/7.2e+02,OrfB